MPKSPKRNKTKLAIFIRYREPKEGGGYTITMDILDQIIKTINKKKIIFIILNDKKKNLYQKINKYGHECVCMNENINLLKFKSFIFSLMPFFLRFYNLINFNKYLNLENEKKIDIVWFLSAEYYYPLFSKYISTVWDLQHITHSSFPETGSFSRRIYREIVIKNFLKNSYKIITGSKILISLMKKRYNISSKNFIYNNHPTPTFFIKEKKISKKKMPIKNFFLYPANFWEHKNHLNLFKGFEQFNEIQKFKYKLVLVGNIANEKYFRKIKKKFNNNFDKNFKILKFVKLKYLLALYDNCLALIYSSFAGPENLPPLEAMARKKKIICSNYPGAKEQLGNIPIYFNPYKPKSIKKALIKFTFSNHPKKNLIRNTSDYLKKVLNSINI